MSVDFRPADLFDANASPTDRRVPLPPAANIRGRLSRRDGRARTKTVRSPVRGIAGANGRGVSIARAAHVRTGTRGVIYTRSAILFATFVIRIRETLARFCRCFFKLRPSSPPPAPSTKRTGKRKPFDSFTRLVIYTVVVIFRSSYRTTVDFRFLRSTFSLRGHVPPRTTTLYTFRAFPGKILRARARKYTRPSTPAERNDGQLDKTIIVNHAR